MSIRGVIMDKTDINVKAFLKLLRYAEHRREDNSVYYILYGGKQTFSDASKHPNKHIKAWGRESTAAGAYQILKGTYDEAVDRGIVRDFTPDSQDKLAIWKIKSRGALDFVRSGDVERAIGRLRSEWASLPGASQSNLTMPDAMERFNRYVKEFSPQ